MFNCDWIRIGLKDQFKELKENLFVAYSERSIGDWSYNKLLKEYWRSILNSSSHLKWSYDLKLLHHEQRP